MDNQQLSALLQIEYNVRKCETLAELLFVITNETRRLLPYEQGFFLNCKAEGDLIASAVTDHPVVDRTAPYVSFIERMASRENNSSANEAIHVIDSTTWKQNEKSDLTEFSPEHLLWVPLKLPANLSMKVGVLWLSRSVAWTERDIALFSHLAGTYAHAIHAFEKKSPFSEIKQRFIKNKYIGYTIAMFILVMFIPVRLSSIAPAEIIAKDPVIISSPLNGAVKTIEVLPGQQIKGGDTLFYIDNTELENAVHVAEQDLLQMKAELRTAQQSSFLNSEQKAKIAELTTQVSLKEIERDFAQSRLNKSVVKSPHAGLVIFKDPKDWEGKPVVVGERIMSLADPTKIELRVMLPVKDAIEFQSGAEIKLFLDTDAFHSFMAKVKYVAYEPERTPDNIVAYKLIAELNSDQDLHALRIGMRGSAKLYGPSVSLFYYIFRRPMTAVRQWMGW
jgi:Multidrug resistance efflux pump